MHAAHTLPLCVTDTQVCEATHSTLCEKGKCAEKPKMNVDMEQVLSQKTDLNKNQPFIMECLHV